MYIYVNMKLTKYKTIYLQRGSDVQKNLGSESNGCVGEAAGGFKCLMMKRLWVWDLTH